MNSKQTTEKAFESYVTEILSSENVGWANLNRNLWDKSYALFPQELMAFLEDSQPDLFQEMRDLHGANLQSMLIAALVKELDVKGSLFVLRNGFKFYGKTFRLAYFKPAHGLSPDVLALYEKNRLGVTRQVYCHPNDNKTVDVMLSLNGLPIATIELKNPQTGQTYRHAIKQYREDRNPSAPLFNFKSRSLVHFAADSEEVYMTTRLAGDKTFFLPLNRGSHPGQQKCGAGNPGHPSGYRTGYFWEEVLQRDSILEIVGQFMFIEQDEKTVDDGKGGRKTITTEKMIFPRYHQLRAVRRLVSTSRAEGSGYSYLIQHSAGSGKTNSISWLAHRLSTLHNEANQKVFDCVIVITDRRVLDSQLQDAVYQIEHAQGVVKAIDRDSKQLAEALVDETKIVVTTLQKFPFVLNGLLKVAGAEDIEKPTEEQKKAAEEWATQLSKRRYALIVDEAHSSQSGDTAKELKGMLGSRANTSEDMLNQAVESGPTQPNLSFFAFTATPKGKTIDLFGRKNSEGVEESFDVYSMRQAIEEGFILDVLQNYTIYDTYFRLVKKIEDDPNVPKRKGSRALAKFMTLHPHNIEQKIEVIVEHFRLHVQRLLGGNAKAMIVTSSRKHAVKFKLALERYLKEHGYTGIHALVAFSGTVKLDAKDSDYTGPDSSDYTEPQMNIDVVSGKQISESQLPARFDSDDYQILLVADKYQTGFDQPRLMAMYVDKRLDGVQAVQTLSRLNRKIPGKESENIFVLDFVNKATDIYKAFKPYYDKTSLQESADPHKLEQIKHDLDKAQIYHQEEVEAFAGVYYKLPSQQRSKDHADLNRHTDPCKQRFIDRDDEDDAKWDFRDKLSAYVSLYSFLSQIMPYGDPELEKLYSFAKFALPKLPRKGESVSVVLTDEIALSYYRLKPVWADGIKLVEGEEKYVKSPTDVGTGGPEEPRAPLSELIKSLNDKFGSELTEEDRLFFEQVREKATQDDRVIQTALANPFDKFQMGIKKLLDDLMIARMAENDEIVTKYMGDDKYKAIAFPFLAQAIFESVHKNAAREPDAE